MSDVPRAVHDLAVERAERRAAKDFAGADELRDRIARPGMVGRRRARRLAAGADRDPAEDVRRPIRAHDVGSVLDEPATADVSIHWVVEGWPLDVRRAIDSFRANAGSRDVHYVVADVTGEPDATWGDDVEVVRPRDRHRLGRGAQRRAEAITRPGGPGDGRLRRGDRRRPRPARGRARRPHRRRVRSVRHRDPRPPRVRRDRRAGGGCHRGLLHGVPARASSRRRACSTRSSAGTGRRTSSTRSGSRIWDSGRWSFPFRWSVTSIGCGSRRRPRIARGGPSGTSTGSSIGGATATTSPCRGNHRRATTTASTTITTTTVRSLRWTSCWRASAAREASRRRGWRPSPPPRDAPARAPCRWAAPTPDPGSAWSRWRTPPGPSRRSSP